MLLYFCKFFTNANLVKMFDSVAKIFYILIYFLYNDSINESTNYCEMVIEIFDYNCELIFSCSRVSFCLVYFEALLLCIYSQYC